MNAVGPKLGGTYPLPPRMNSTTRRIALETWIRASARHPRDRIPPLLTNRRRFVGMKSLLLATLLLLPLNGYAQVKQESWQRANLMDDKFENYKNDFRQFALARPSSPDAETDMTFMVVADQTVSHLRCVETLVAI